MDPARRFIEYAADFERTVGDDDWTRLERHFAEDAVYSVTGGPPLGGRWEGRSRVLGQLRRALDELDRRFDERRVEPLGQPEVGEAHFELGWRACYRKAGCPDLTFDGRERASFDDRGIVRLDDVVEDGTDRRIQDYLARYLD